MNTRFNRRRKSKRQGWRYVLVRGAALVFTVACLNVLLAAIPAGALNGKEGRWIDGVALLYKGTPTAVNTRSAILHLALSGLSSVLLAASNYTMQCLSAPTRQEVDTAHWKGSSLDIGLPSIRNMCDKATPWSRKCLWLLLLLTSIPIHFLYNATIYTSRNINSYGEY